MMMMLMVLDLDVTLFNIYFVAVQVTDVLWYRGYLFQPHARLICQGQKTLSISTLSDDF